MADDPPRPADVPAGCDDADPYSGADLSTYPGWWRENVESFREHGMRPYRPPQFADGTLVPELLQRLESELCVGVTLRKYISADADESWTLLVDGDRVADLDRVRNEEGRSVYSVTGEEFERLVTDAAGR